MPVDGRFEHIVLSCNATSDHAIIWIEREAQRALDVSFRLKQNLKECGSSFARKGLLCSLQSVVEIQLVDFQLMLEKAESMEIPPKQRMERKETLAKEHTEEYKAALQRAVTLAVPHAYSPSPYGTFDEQEEEHSYGSIGESSFGSTKKSKTFVGRF